MIQVDQSKAGGLISKELDAPSDSIHAGGHAYFRTVNDSDVGIFWVLQCLGWSGISLLTYLSLSLPYAQFELSYLAHNLAQSILGLLLTSVMRLGFRWVWSWPIAVRLASIFSAVLVFSGLWAVLRLLLFMAMTGESNLWSDFGGWVFPSIFVFLAWAALYHGIKYYRLQQQEHQSLLRFESRRRQEALKLAQAESDVREAHLKLLRYQINPHFLFNTLNSVSALIEDNSVKDAQKMLVNLATFLRFSLDGERDRAFTVTLREEIDALNLYFEIELVRFADRLQVTFDIEECAFECKLPSLLLQPLVENAIKHAIAKCEAGGEIRVSARMECDELMLSVEDSGVLGQAVSSNSAVQFDAAESSGVGMSNTRARLTTLYGEKFTLHVGSSGLGGFKIDIALPAIFEVQNLTEGHTSGLTG